jgi:hypothetical protein
MSDPRNAAHQKKVKQEKAHHETASGSEGSPKKKRGKTSGNEDGAVPGTPPPAEAPKVEVTPGELEKSQTVLSKLKEMEFHSRANIETLAGLSLTIEDELKQKEFSEPVGALYSAQEEFHTKIAALIQSYEAKCESLKPSA